MPTNHDPQVLLLHAAGQPMGEARRRAEAMALVLGARLVVVKLSRPVALRAHALFPHAHVADGVVALQQAMREARALERWQAARAYRGLPELEVVCCSPALESIAAVCERPGVALVVAPASFAAFAERLTGLAASAGVPVLVARRPGADERLVVATNLEDPARPVLQQALGLADRLDAPLTVVHNAPGLGAQLAAAGLGAAMLALPRLDELQAAEQERELRRELGALGRPAAVTVTRRLDAATGILEASIAARADVIVLGVRARSGPGLFADHVAERVCSAAERSVLLVPV